MTRHWTSCLLKEIESEVSADGHRHLNRALDGACTPAPLYSRMIQHTRPRDRHSQPGRGPPGLFSLCVLCAHGGRHPSPAHPAADQCLLPHTPSTRPFVRDPPRGALPLPPPAPRALGPIAESGSSPAQQCGSLQWAEKLFPLRSTRAAPTHPAPPLSVSTPAACVSPHPVGEANLRGRLPPPPPLVPRPPARRHAGRRALGGGGGREGRPGRGAHRRNRWRLRPRWWGAAADGGSAQQAKPVAAGRCRRRRDRPCPCGRVAVTGPAVAAGRSRAVRPTHAGWEGGAAAAGATSHVGQPPPPPPFRPSRSPPTGAAAPHLAPAPPSLPPPPAGHAHPPWAVSLHISDGQR